MKKVVGLLVVLGLFFLANGCSRGMATAQFETEGNSIYKRVVDSSVPWQTIGQSVEGRDIYKIEFGEGDSTTLIIGGFHGAEIRGVDLALAFAEYLHNNEEAALNARVVVVPVLNPDGLVRQSRLNANNIDVNRNFPTANWTAQARSPRYNPGNAPASEPETRLAMMLVETYQPQRIISIHAPLEVVNYDGPGRVLAEKMAVFNGYPVSGDIGYPTPGSFGNYAGVEKQIPTITLELPRGPFAPMWEGNRDALLAACRF